MKFTQAGRGHVCVEALKGLDLPPEHDPEKACPALDAGCEAVFPRDKRKMRLRGDHAQSGS